MVVERFCGPFFNKDQLKTSGWKGVESVLAAVFVCTAWGQKHRQVLSEASVLAGEVELQPANLKSSELDSFDLSAYLGAVWGALCSQSRNAAGHPLTCEWIRESNFDTKLASPSRGSQQLDCLHVVSGS
eukprot:178192-Rhodomonas_salina.2